MERIKGRLEYPAIQQYVPENTLTPTVSCLGPLMRHALRWILQISYVALSIFQKTGRQVATRTKKALPTHHPTNLVGLCLTICSTYSSVSRKINKEVSYEKFYINWQDSHYSLGCLCSLILQTFLPLLIWLSLL